MQRIMALDVGSVRIGVAISDPLGITAQPFEVINRRKTEPLQRIRAIIEEREVGHIVVGNPLRLSGEAGPAADAIREFTKALENVVDVPITLWDERLSTAAAQRDMISGGARRDRRKQTIDKIAAALILQSYLDAQRTPL